jgi:glycosyltransferase involved in cell wall biosynthesis
MPPQPVVLGWSQFRPSAGAHGGNVRSEQIAALVGEAGFAYSVIDRTGGGHPIADRLRGLAQKALHRRRWPGISAPLLGFYLALLERAMRGHEGPRVLLCEDTLLPVPLWCARAHRFKTIALPHNVESLAGSGSDLRDFDAEFLAMRQADAIFCISDSDAWLWANLGLEAHVLPYSPVGKRRERLEAIAASRVRPPAPESPWLILGTAHNAPTREGMSTVLRWLAPAVRGGLPVVVAGHGSESLANDAPPGVTFAGSVSDDSLDALLRRARGLIVHQDRGTGALTRIPEALVAGLPVLASRIAARGTESMEGVSRYETASDLLALLNSPIATPPKAATAQKGTEFVARLRDFARAS